MKHESPLPLEIHDLTVSHEDKPVLYGIDLEISDGVLVGIIVSGYVFLISKNTLMTICIGVSIILNMGLASFLGSALPILLKSLNIDPAIASAPFISTTLDIIGQVVYFCIAIFLFTAFL